MNKIKKYTVSSVKYKRPFESVKRAIELCLGELKPGSKVFIKPNIVFWTRDSNFPKWGVITTSRVVYDTVAFLKDLGIHDITIGEGIVTRDPKDRKTPAHAFESLGFLALKSRYGVKCFNIMERPFKKKDLGCGIRLSFNRDALESDFVINLPVMKTHNQTVVSLGIKNLKGLIDIPSRKKCHTITKKQDLNFIIARLADIMPAMLTIIDGIYTLEMGPGFDGKARRSNIIVASTDILSADMAAAKFLGHNPEDVPHLVYAAKNRNRPIDMSDINIQGDKIDSHYHKYDFQYTEYEKGCFLPKPLARDGIKGISYRKYDLSMCTYCSGLNGLILSAIRAAWKGEPWDNIEIITGKSMKPTRGKNKTILIGNCMYKANKDNPDIKNMFAVKGCPPDLKMLVKSLREAGIEVDPKIFESVDQLPGLFMSRYQNRPEFDESFFSLSV